MDVGRSEVNSRKGFETHSLILPGDMVDGIAGQRLIPERGLKRELALWSN